MIRVSRVPAGLGLDPAILAAYLEDRHPRGVYHPIPEYSCPRSIENCPNKAAYVDALIRRRRAQVISIRDLILVTWAARELRRAA